MFNPQILDHPHHGGWRITDHGGWRITDHGGWRITYHGGWRITDHGGWRITDMILLFGGNITTECHRC